jgi:hypothetical protein
MTFAWRFFNEPAGWKWQQLSADREILAESRASYPTYDACIRAAASRGYSFVASQSHLTGSPNLYTPQRSDDGTASAAAEAEEDSEAD